MATDYTEFVTLAKDLVKENGREVTLQRLSATPADSTKSWKGAGAPTVVQSVANVPAVFIPSIGFASSGFEFGRRVMDDNLLKRVEQVALIAQQVVNIEQFSTILDSSVSWKIEWIETLKPANDVLLYLVGVKR